MFVKRAIQAGDFKADYLIVGNPTITNDGIVSEFSANDYLEISKFPTGVTNLEMVWKVKFSSVSYPQFFYNSAPYYSCLIGTVSGKLGFWLSNNTTSWDIVENAAGVTPLLTDTWYYVKFTYDGETYKLYQSTDNINWNLESSLVSTKTIGVNYDAGRIGHGFNIYPASNTTVDLKESYIKIGGAYFWTGFYTKGVEINAGQYALMKKGILHHAGDFKSGSYTVAGTPTITSGGIASGFSTSNYLKLPTSARNKYATYYFKFTTGSLSTSQVILHCENFVNLELTTAGLFRVYSWTNQGTWTAYSGVTANTTYWVKIVCTGTGKTYYFSTDGETYTDSFVLSDTSMNASSSSDFRLGLSSYNSSSPYLGTIDLKECYAINDADEIIWGNTYMEDVPCNKPYAITMRTRTIVHQAGDSNYTVLGSPTITSDGLVSGFSTINYLETPKTFPTGVTDLEIVFKVKFSALRFDYFFNTALDFSLALGISNSGFLRFYLSNNTTNWDIGYGEGATTLTTDTWYYVKFTYDGATYKLYQSTDNITWNLECSLSSTTTIGVNYKACRIGYGFTDSPATNTTVDLKESYIKIDGAYWWTGFYPDTEYKDNTKYYMIKRTRTVFVPAQTLLDTDTAGTYTLDLEAGDYEIAVVGAGGGGSRATKNSLGASGGSGAAFVGIVTLAAGSYEIVVGAAGVGSGASGGVNGADGTASYIKATVGSMTTTIVNAGAGGGGVRDTSGGTAGTISTTTGSAMTVCSETIKSNGNAGVGYYGGGSTSNTASVYDGYGFGGAGGWTQYGEGVAGGNGYVRIKTLAYIKEV